MRRGFVWLGLVAGLSVAGCQEKLTSPAECPALCPGGDIGVNSLTLLPDSGRDSTFTGYVARGRSGGTRASNGLGASEDRAVVRFVPREMTVPVGDTRVPYTVDSVAILVPLAARDTSAKDLRLLLYRLTLDSTVPPTFAGVEAQLVEANLIDSIVVPDSVAGGTVRASIGPDELGRLGLTAENTVLTLGIGVRADTATGVILGGSSLSTPFQLITYAQFIVADTVQRQPIPRGAAFTDYVSAPTTAVDSSLLVVGGAPSSRSLVRFTVPEVLRDSAAIVRATLVLTPAMPITGLPSDTAFISAYNVQSDLGGKSPLCAIPNQACGPLRLLSIPTVPLEFGSDPVEIDVTRLVQGWTIGTGAPPAFFLVLSPEGESFTNPVFGSTRTPALQPRLLIDYTLPFVDEVP